MFKKRHSKKQKKETSCENGKKSKASKGKKSQSKLKPSSKEKTRKPRASKKSPDNADNLNRAKEPPVHPEGKTPEAVQEATDSLRANVEENLNQEEDMNNCWQQGRPRGDPPFWQDTWDFPMNNRHNHHRGYFSNEPSFRPPFQQWRSYDNQGGGMPPYRPHNFQSRPNYHWSGNQGYYRGQQSQPGGIQAAEGWLSSRYDNREPVVAARPTDSALNLDRPSSVMENPNKVPPTNASIEHAIKKEMLNETVESSHSASTERTSHLIFLSSEEEDNTSSGQPRGKKSKDQQKPETLTSTKRKLKPPKSSGERTQNRMEHSAKGGVTVPALSSFPSKEAFRKDVLDRLVNYPCSRRVRSQLSKFVAQLKGPQSQLPAQQQERPLLNLTMLSAQELDLQGLVKEMEAGDLPGELLQSLMVAFEDGSDAEHEGGVTASNEHKTLEDDGGASTKVNGSKAGKKSPATSPSEESVSKVLKAKVPKTKTAKSVASDKSNVASPPSAKQKAQCSSPTKSGTTKTTTDMSARVKPVASRSPVSKASVIKKSVSKGSVTSKQASTKPKSSVSSKSKTSLSPKSSKSPGKELPPAASKSAIGVKGAAEEMSAGKQTEQADTEEESDEECVVLPTPVKVIESVNIVDSDEEEEAEKMEEEMDAEEDTCLEPEKPCVPRLSKPEGTTSKPAESSLTTSQALEHASERPTAVSSAPILPSAPSPSSVPRPSSAPRLLSGPWDSSATRTLSVTKPPSSCALSLPSQSAGPTLTSVPQDANTTLHLSSSNTVPPAPMAMTCPAEVKVTDTAAVPLMPSIVSQACMESAKIGDALSAFVQQQQQHQVMATELDVKEEVPEEEGPRALVSELILLCQEEEQVRSQCVVAQQNIVSLTTALEQWKLKQEQLTSRETQIRKRRLELLRSLQDTVGGEQSHANSSSTVAEQAHIIEALRGMPATSSLSEPAPGKTEDATADGGAACNATTGVTYLGALGTTLDIMQQILPHMQQLGDVPLPPPETVHQASTFSNPIQATPPGAKTSAKRKKSADAGNKQKKTKQNKSENEHEQDDSRLKDIPETLEIKAHDGAVVAVKLHKGYVYTCATDYTAKRFDLTDPSKCIIYGGHTKTLSSLEVQQGKSAPTWLYTTCKDGYLRCFNADSAEQTLDLDVESPICCSASAWGRLFLGLQNGYVAVFNLKGQQVVERYACSDGPVGRLCTAVEGAQRLLCTLAVDGRVGVRDAATGLLLRCLGSELGSASTPITIRPPACLALAGGSIYTAASDRSVVVHELRTGILQKVYEAKSAATGLKLYKNHLLCCSFDGLIRCYKLKDFTCELIYYGAGKNMVMCMDTIGPLIVTGNRKGIVELVTFDRTNIHPCEVGSCRLQFGREEDLLHHLKREHLALGAPAVQSHCPWQHCNMAFTGPTSAKDFEKHLMDHACT